MFAVFQLVKKLMSAWQHIKLGCIFAVMTILVPLSAAGNLVSVHQAEMALHFTTYILQYILFKRIQK